MMSFGKNHHYIFTTHLTTTKKASQQPHQDEGPRSSLNLRHWSYIGCTWMASQTMAIPAMETSKVSNISLFHKTS